MSNLTQQAVRCQRPIMRLVDDLMEESKLFQRDPAHQTPRCKGCRRILHPGILTDTGLGHYDDGPALCAFCKAERNAQLGSDL